MIDCNENNSHCDDILPSFEEVPVTMATADIDPRVVNLDFRPKTSLPRKRAPPDDTEYL